MRSTEYELEEEWLDDNCCWCGTCDCDRDEHGCHLDPDNGRLMDYSEFEHKRALKEEK